MRRDRFDRLVRRAVMSLPREFRRRLDNVVVSVRDRADRRLLDGPGGEGLLGLYVGVPLPERSLDTALQMPDQIFVFQRAIEAVCRSEADIVRQVRITVVHEVGHFFGLSDDEIEAVLGP